MLLHHFRISWRLLFKNRLFTAIKLSGLTAGITACLLIGLYLHHELTYDAFHTKADRIVRATMEYRANGETQAVCVTGNKVVPTFRRDFPEVETGARVIAYTMVVKNGAQVFEEKNVYFADSTFFDIFTFPLLQGDARTALTQPKQVVLTRRMAAKYFGTDNPVGKTLQVGTTGEYTVTGVMADAPTNSQLKPDFVASIVGLRDMAPERATWWNANYASYFLLHDAGSRAPMEAKIKGYMRQFASETRMEGDDYLSYRLEPLRSVHLHSAVAGNFEPNGDIRYMYILGAVALFILLIGAFMYINLTMAASTERAREVGVQKVLGADQSQLFWQYLAEAGALTGVSLVLSYALAAPLLPLFNHLFDRALTWSPLLRPEALLSAVGFAALVSLLAGAYPALVVAHFKPVKVLKGQFKFSSSGIWLRKSLIVLQFTISSILLICTLVLQQQMRFIQEKKLGFDRDHVIALATDKTVVEKLQAFKTEFQQNSNVGGVSLVYESPIEIRGGYSIDPSVASNKGTPVRALPVDEDFVKTMHVGLAAGSDLSKADVDLIQRQNEGKDTAAAIAILINAKQAQQFGWTPDEAVGRTVNFNGRPAMIKGVMQDFHFSSLHEPIGPLVVFPDTWGNTLLVKLSGRALPGTLQFLQQKWQALAPHRPFTYHFLDEEYDKLYSSERQTARLVSLFSALAIFLAGLGLFGLATYSIVQRTKEIGIRKVLGASVSGIVGWLARDFVWLVAIGLVVASPVAWFLLREWLADFAYRVEIGWSVFAVAGILAVAIGFLSVSYQSVRAALANPIDSLRSE